MESAIPKLAVIFVALVEAVEEEASTLVFIISGEASDVDLLASTVLDHGLLAVDGI